MWSRLHVWRGDPPHVTSLTWDPPPPCKEVLREHNDQAPGYVVYSSAVTHACGSEDMRARAYAKIKNKKILQIDIFRKFYSNIAYLVWGLFYINSVWKTFAFLTFRWQKKQSRFLCLYLPFRAFLDLRTKRSSIPPVKALQALTSAFLRTLLLARPCV